MKNKNYSMKSVYLVTSLIVVIMLFLQLIILGINSSREAKTATTARLRQVEIILEKNDHEETALLSSLKDEYTILAKAVAYYLDHNSSAVNDIEELKKLCSLLSIDEIHIFDETGKIFSSSVENYIGYTLDSGDQIGYFKPMLEDRTMTMCQDVTPNTAEGKPMVYAMTWNEPQTLMVQVGIEPVRLISELKLKEIEKVIGDISVDKNITITVADASTLEIVGSTEPKFTGNNLKNICNLDFSKITDETTFFKKIKLSDNVLKSFCSAKNSGEYCICVFLDYNYFFNRILESLFLVFIYLLLATFVITFIFKRLLSSRQENIQHMEVFQSMSEIYYSLHLVNLKKNTVIEYSAKNHVKDNYNKETKVKADVMMKNIMHATMSDAYLQRGLEFSDITTLPERMKDKKVISMELLGKNVGWIRMSFITITATEGIPNKIIVATQIIDEEKKAAELLYAKSHTDELTKCYNRRAYNNDILTFLDAADKKEFIYISLDLNGLKTVNDDLGHEAGDEMIKGAVDCMNKAFSEHGKIYRTGGDEFVALLFTDAETIKHLTKEFDKILENWHGDIVKTVSVSYGYVVSSELKGKSVLEIASLADKRMYEAKEKYYKDRGITRRRT